MRAFYRRCWLLLLTGVACTRSAPLKAPAPNPPPSPTLSPITLDGGDDVAAPAKALTAAALDAGAPRLRHRGVNLSGAEFGACCPGTLGRDYGYPTEQDVDLFAARGVAHIRVPFRHERLQRALKADLDAGEWERLERLVSYATSKGLSVAIEPHNSARYNGVVLTETAMGDLWARIARRFMAKPYASQVWFNLTNEPHDMATETWLSLAQAAIREIRRVGSTATIACPGNMWTGAAHWTASWGGTPNSLVMQQVTDPGTVFEVHLYLDQDGSGSGKECVSETIGTDRLRAFVMWLKTHGRRGYLGEIGAPNTLLCRKAVTNTLAYIESEPQMWIGWAWWSAGSRWPAGYQLSVQPLQVDAGAAGALWADRPQMDWLRPFFCGGAR